MKNDIPLEHIVNSIKNGYSSGYAPFRELFFGEYYQSWYILDKIKNRLERFFK